MFTAQLADRIDIVTITLFSRELDADTFHQGMFKEVDNIQRMIKGLSHAAQQVGRNPPKFVLTVNLIPNWGRLNNGYDNPQYLELKDKFLAQVRKVFGHLPIEIKDFYT